MRVSRYLAFAVVGNLLVGVGAGQAATRWIPVTAASRIGFEVSQAGATVKGEFRRFDSDIAFDPNDLSSSKVRVEVDVASVSTGAEDRDRELPKPDWFDLARFPRAVFEAETFERNENGFIARGTLSLRDVKQPVSLPFTLDINGETARMDAKLDLDRTTFGVGQGMWAASDMVGKTVSLTIHLEAKRN
jgi:polyisoprenoid-binding protein YceI